MGLFVKICGIACEEDAWAVSVLKPDAMGFIPLVALPGLRELGVDEDAIRVMTVDTPRRWLAGA